MFESPPQTVIEAEIVPPQPKIEIFLDDIQAIYIVFKLRNCPL